jgi:hypothetical protein
MKNMKSWAWIVFFGSIWGISEVAGGGALYAMGIPHSSIFLSAWAFFILAMARGLVNKPGSSTVVGGIAVLFKLINAAPFWCHLLAIFSLGVAFDIFASLLLKKKIRRFVPAALTGAAGAYGGFALFAILITYVIRYSFWVEGGINKVLNYIFLSGSIVALISLFLVPLGFRIGLASEHATVDKPRWVYAGTAAAVLFIWIVVRFV